MTKLQYRINQKVNEILNSIMTFYSDPIDHNFAVKINIKY